MSVFLLLLMILLQQDPEVTPPVEEPLLDTVQAAFSASTTTPLIGEPFTLTLTAETPLDIEIIEWGEIPATWKPFEVLASSGIQQQTEDGSTTYQQQIEAVIWRVGDYSTPQLYIAYRITGDERVYRVPVRNAFFSVPSILETQDLNQLQPRPYRPPISLFYLPPWVMLAMFGVLGGSMWLMWRWWEKRREQLMILPEPTPYEKALEFLKSDNLRDAIPISLRIYLEGRFSIPAQHMTTLEIVQSLQHRLSETQRDTLWVLLEHSDVLKYGGVQSANDEQLLATTIEWLEQMEEISHE